MRDPEVIANMKARASQCRRLADAMTDRATAAVLIKMAEEAEADIARLEAEMPNPMPPAADA